MHHRKIRSTSGLERIHQEIQRRTRVVRIFSNREVCLRLVTALCVDQGKEWRSGKRYLDVRHVAPNEDAAFGLIPATLSEGDDMAPSLRAESGGANDRRTRT